MEERAKHIDEEREISAIDGILQSLYEKDLLTHIECRIIVCTRKFPEKQLAFFRIMMSKGKETAAQLGQWFWAMTQGLHAEEKLKLPESDYKSANNGLDSPLEAKKNPMLNNTVIKCVFGFLPLDDIKNCRVVSRQWNSTAEVLLRKRAKIHFRTDGLRPETFLAVSKFSLPDLPFSAFKFSECENTQLFWREPELEDFFEKWGGNIKELNLDNINIECAKDSSKLLNKYDITPWLENASKLTSLTIDGAEDNYDDDDEGELNMSLSLDQLKILPEIKTFILRGNSIEFCPGKENTRMVLDLEIELSNITCTRGDVKMQQFRYNDFFAFSQAVTINLNNCEQKMTSVLDMGDQVFKNADVLCLDKITIENWKKAAGCVRHVELRGISFIEKNHLKIQSLQISGSAIDLFAIPETVERVHVYNCNISCSESFSLPKLKFLKFEFKESRAPLMTRFRLDSCENLKELVICYYLNEETSLTRMFDVRSLPINLQVLRMKGNLKKYLADDWILEIPGLVVLESEYGVRFSNYTRICKQFRTVTLVVVCYAYMKVSTVDIVEFLLANMQKEPKRIFIGMKYTGDDLHTQTPFEGSLFSNIVNKKSNYYEFENSNGIVGKAITRDQFLNGCVSIGDESIPFFLKEE